MTNTFLFICTGKNPVKDCHHPMRGYCQQDFLLPDDTRIELDDMYTDSDKVLQDQFIASHLTLTPVKRTMVAAAQRKRQKDYNRHYHVYKSDGHPVEVCCRTFRAIFSVGAKRVKNIVAHRYF